MLEFGPSKLSFECLAFDLPTLCMGVSLAALRPIPGVGARSRDHMIIVDTQYGYVKMFLLN